MRGSSVRCVDAVTVRRRPHPRSSFAEHPRPARLPAPLTRRARGRLERPDERTLRRALRQGTAWTPAAPGSAPARRGLAVLVLLLEQGILRTRAIRRQTARPRRTRGASWWPSAGDTARAPAARGRSRRRSSAASSALRRRTRPRVGEIDATRRSWHRSSRTRVSGTTAAACKHAWSRRALAASAFAWTSRRGFGHVCAEAAEVASIAGRLAEGLRPAQSLRAPLRVVERDDEAVADGAASAIAPYSRAQSRA